MMRFRSEVWGLGSSVQPNRMRVIRIPSFERVSPIFAVVTL